MKILITGGAGYIGSHTCVEFLNKGYEIVVLDNFSNSKPEALTRVSEITGKSFHYYNVDLLNLKMLEKIFFKHKIDAVIHFAGLKAVGESNKVPLKYYQNNVVGTINLCETMSKFQVKKLVFSSSATVYGSTEQVPISEETSLGAVNPYGRTKQMIEEILKDLYNSDDNWSIALLRYFNPAGAHKSGLIGEDPKGIPNNLVPYLSQVTIGRIQSLSIFGNDYPTADGTGVRDYIHVVDLAKGHLKAFEKVKNENGINAYNLGTGKGFSVMEMVKAYEKASGQIISYTVKERRPGDAAICYANPLKAKAELDWEATLDINDICNDAWNWQKNNPNGYDKVSENDQPIPKSKNLIVSN